MEDKLEAYRRGKRRQAIINNFKEKLFNMVSLHQIKTNEKAEHVITVDTNDDEHSKSNTNSSSQHTTKSSHKSHNSSDSEDTESLTSSTTLSDNEKNLVISASDNIDSIRSTKTDSKVLTYFTYLVYFLFWVTLYAIAIQLKFGIVYLMLSALIGIYLNTRTEPKDENEISAYSVFNKDLHAIDGTLKAEQFEREIGIRHK